MSTPIKPDNNATLPQIRLDEMVLSPLARQLFDTLRSVVGPQLATAIVRDAIPRGGAELASLDQTRLPAVIAVVKDATRPMPNADKISGALDALIL